MKLFGILRRPIAKVLLIDETQQMKVGVVIAKRTAFKGKLSMM